jgi:hypothetical protein
MPDLAALRAEIEGLRWCATCEMFLWHRLGRERDHFVDGRACAIGIGEKPTPEAMRKAVLAILDRYAAEALDVERLARALEQVRWGDYTRTNEITTDADAPNRVFESEVDVLAFADAIAREYAKP